MKRLMIIGGGPNQLSLINAALGDYDVFLCDGSDHPLGKALVPEDRFLHADISKPDIVAELCSANRIDGIVCNTESLMLCTSVVQKQLGFVGNDPQAILAISDKSKFRQTQQAAGVFHPKSFLTPDYSAVQGLLDETQQPVIIKPDESSGSRGVRIFDSIRSIDRASYDFCLNCSRNRKVVIEEFIPFDMDRAYEAEAFLVDGKLEYLFLYRTIRDKKKCLVPQCYCSNTGLSDEKEAEIQALLQRVFETAGISWGQYNVELVLTDEEDIFIIEINPRQGGMMLPKFVHIFSGVDVDKLLVSTAVGDYRYFQSVKAAGIRKNPLVQHFRLLADVQGIYRGYRLSDQLKERLVYEWMYAQTGEKIVPGASGYASIGTLDFVYESLAEEKRMEEEIFGSVEVFID